MSQCASAKQRCAGRDGGGGGDDGGGGGLRGAARDDAHVLETAAGGMPGGVGRAGDIAVMRVLGLTPRQARFTLSWQATTIAAVSGPMTWHASS